MIKVKISTDNIKDVLLYTPNRSGMWDNCQFFINDDTYECDYWFVIHSVSSKVVAKCPPENMYYVGGEPTSTCKFRTPFVKQFHNIVTSQTRKYDVPNTIGFTPLNWWIGTQTKGYGYDELKAISPEKTKLISVISSNKTLTPMHKLRIKFVQRLKEHFGDRLDVYGSGINTFDDKWDAIAPYKYHICLENSTEKNYFSEKLMDSYLGEAYPIYFGCENMEDYYDGRAFTRIDMSKPDEAIEIIEKVLAGNLYEKRIEDIKHAKGLTLDQYNIMAVIAQIVHDHPGGGEPKEMTVWPTRKCKRLARLKRFIFGE